MKLRHKELDVKHKSTQYGETIEKRQHNKSILFHY